MSGFVNRAAGALAPAAAVLCVAGAAFAQSGSGEAPRLVEQPLDTLEMREFVVTNTGKVLRETTTPISTGRSNCTQQVSSYSGFDWNNAQSGVEVVVQAGFVEGEIMAAEYVLSEDAYPLRLDTIQAVIASAGTNVTTVTRYTILVWEGNPETGTLVASFSSDDPISNPAAPPDIELPPGDNGVILSFQIDPQADPTDQIFIGEGSPPPGNAFTIGFRIDEHNNQSGTGCLFPPPATSNAFPTTDSASPNFASDRQRNWLFAIDCGFGISAAPPGWNRFTELPPVFGLRVEPGGDWNLRAFWTSFNPNCGTLQTGCCCIPGGFNFPDFSEQDCVNGGGTWAGPGTDCSTPEECDVFGCAQDLDGDDLVATSDLLVLLGAWGTAGPNGDIDGDNLVGTSDLLELLAAWGQTCDQL